MKSPFKPQPARGGSSLNQPRANKHYSFKDERVDSLFNLLNKSNRLKLPKSRHPEEVGKTDNPNYCLYHRILGHPTKNCYIFKDILQTLIDAEMRKLRSEQKKVTANMMSFLQFGVARVVPIPKGELRVLNIDPHHQQEKGLIPVLLLREKSCGFIPTLWKTNSGLLLPTGSLKAKQKLHLVMWCVLLPEKQKLMSPR